MSLCIRVISRLLAACIFTATLSAATATGSVTASATQLPLGSMTVAAYDTAGIFIRDTTTDANGRYSLTLPDAHYRLLAYDPAGVYATTFSGNAESFETSPSTDLTASATVSFSLPKAGSVSGRTLSPDGSSLEGLTVAAYNISGTRRAFTRTAANGAYKLILPPGDYKLVTYDEGGVFGTSFHRDVRAFADATVVRVGEEIDSAVVFRVEPAARVHGVTIAAASGAPLPSMTVYAYTAGGALLGSTATSANGAFSLLLSRGATRLVAADPARVYASAFGGGARSFAGAEILHLAAGEFRSGVSLALERGAKIRGSTRSTAGAPLQDVLVTAYNGDGTAHATARSDAAGVWELLVAPGSYRIGALDESLQYAPQFHRAVYAFRNATFLFAAADTTTEGIDFALERAAHIRGTVTSAQTSQPVAAIRVAAYDAAGLAAASAITASDGRYTLAAPPGAYRVLAYDDELRYANAYAGGATSFETTMPVAVAAGAAETIDLALRAGVRVSGTVRSRAGAPLDDVEIFALDPSGNRTAGATSRGGAFALAVVPSTYRFLAVDGAGNFMAQYFWQASTFNAARAVSVSATENPPAIVFELDPAQRRRAVRH